MLPVVVPDDRAVPPDVHEEVGEGEGVVVVGKLRPVSVRDELGVEAVQISAAGPHFGFGGATSSRPPQATLPVRTFLSALRMYEISSHPRPSEKRDSRTRVRW